MILRDPTSPDGDTLPPNWVQCVFVFSFMMVTIYLLLNLGLAIVCDVYAERNEALGKKREQEQRQNLEAAYALLLRAADGAADSSGSGSRSSRSSDVAGAGAAGKGGGGSSSSSGGGVPTYLVEGVLFRLAVASSAAAGGPARLTRRGVAAVIEDLDPEADGFVARAAFMALPETLASNHERHNHSGAASPVVRRRAQEQSEQSEEQPPRGPSPSHGRAEEGKLGGEGEGEGEGEQLQQRQGYTHKRLRFVDLWCPRLARHGAFRRLERLVQGPYLDGFINLVIVANLALACFAHGEHPSSGQGKGLLSQQEFMLVCALIFTAEAAAKLLVLGWKRYVASYVNVFDFVLTLLSIGGAALELARGGGGTTAAGGGGRHHALLLFELLRVLRLCRALLSVPVFRSTAATFAGILPASTALLLNLFALTFAFAAVGLEAYGGLVNKGG